MMENSSKFPNLYFVFSYALRDLFSSYKRLVGILSTLFFSLLIYSTILTINKSLQNELDKNQKILLGGDVEIDYNRNFGDQKLINQISKFSEVSNIVEFNSMIFNDNKSSFTRIKSVDSKYPLYGTLETFPINSYNLLKQNDDLILLNKNIFKNLNLKLNDVVKIQGISFRVVGYIEKIPDVGGAFIFGDYAIIHANSLKKLKLKTLGNLIDNKYKVKFNSSLTDNYGIKKINSILKNDKNHNIKLPKHSGRGLKIILNNFAQFLSLLSISALLIAAVGIANSFLSYLNEKYTSIAIKKSLGLKNIELKYIYFFQISFLLFVTASLAYFVSLYSIPILNMYLNNFYNLELQGKFSFVIFSNILFVGFIIISVISIPTISAINDIKGSFLLKNVKKNINFVFSKKISILIVIILTIFAAYISYFSYKPIYTLNYFSLFFLCLLSFFLTHKLIVFFLKQLKFNKSVSLKIALNEITRSNSMSSVILITLGLGTTLLLSLGSIGFNVKKEISSAIPEIAPDYFFIGLQNKQDKKFKKFLYKQDENIIINSMPVISAKLIKINNRNPMTYIDQYNDSYWFINNDRRISWSSKLPKNNYVIDGVWWKNNKYSSSDLLISLDNKIATDLNIKLGDKFTLLISGREIEGTIINFRKVNYRDLNINFAMLINPSFAKILPSEILATAKFQDTTKFDKIAFIEEFPNVSYIEIKNYVDKISSLLRNIYVSLSLVSLIITIIGFFVIISAVIVQNKIKTYQNLVLKLIGLTKKQITLISIYEFSILYTFTIFLSTLFSLIISRYATIHLFKIEWQFAIDSFIGVIAIIAFLIILLIIFTNFKNLSPKIYPLIRNE